MSTDTDWSPNFGQLDGTALNWAAKRPVRIALLGDFGAGASAGRLNTGDELARLKPRSVEFDSLEDWLGQQNLTLQLPVGAGGAPVDVPLGDLDAFHPDALYRELDLFKKLHDLRKRLNNTATFDKAAAEVAKWGGGTKKKASRAGRGSRARGATPNPGARLDDFARLTGRTSVAAASSGGGIDALLRDAISPFIVPAAKPEKTALLGTVDAAIADVMRALLHQGDFQTTESLWRGVDFLLRRLETGPMLQVHLIDISAEELAADLSGSDDLTESGLYRLLAAKPAEAKDGGYTYVAGLYQFEATPPHTELLGRMAKVCSAAGAPFLTGMAIDDLADPRKPPHALVREAFKALRELPEAKSLVLLGPRFLLRHPYGKRSDPISAFSFEEFTPADGLGGLLWGHPALLALTVLAGQNGTPTVNDLPFHHFVDADGDSTALPCTERYLSTAQVTQLRGYGLSALAAHRGEPVVRVTGLDSAAGTPIGAAGAATGGSARAGISMAVKAKLPESSARPGAKAAPAARSNADGDSSSDTTDGTDSTDSADSGSGSSDLDALLAGMDDSGSADSSGTSELDALLASMGSDDSASSDAPAADDDAMDPDLAALLASLG
jgi:type VI secretion system protein ImpC